MLILLTIFQLSALVHFGMISASLLLGCNCCSSTLYIINNIMGNWNGIKGGI